MVRFIMRMTSENKAKECKFTFQYGQIYYRLESCNKRIYRKVYIPIWLDLLSTKEKQFWGNRLKFTFQYGQIYYNALVVRYTKKIFVYIPIWLDLLQKNCGACCLKYTSLHSNMVRFIIVYYDNFKTYMLRFTFQYGQIYYIIRNT